jgi:hypothetical protein
MDEQVMFPWVEEVLAPYVMMAPNDIILLLNLDSYLRPYDGISCPQNSGVGH